MRRFAGFLALVVVGICGIGPQPAEAVVLINEVLADPSALFGDANGDGVISTTQDEFIELVNTGADPVSLAQWTLSDAVQVRHVFSAAAWVPAYSFFVVFGGGAPVGFANVATASTGSLSLNNSGDTVTLRDALAVPVDLFTYGAAGGQDVSLTRSPDAIGPFMKHSDVNSLLFSPGMTTDRSLRLPDSSPQPSIPEPSSLMLLGVGFCGLIRSRRK